jgi:hypothetical protein
MMDRERIKGLSEGTLSTLGFQVLNRILSHSRRHPIQGACRFLLLQRGSSVRHPRLVGAEVRYDPQQPRRELGLVAVAMQVLIGPDERFLNDVFSVVALTRHLIREAIHKKAVPLEQLFEGIVIPLSRSAH